MSPPAPQTQAPGAPGAFRADDPDARFVLPHVRTMVWYLIDAESKADEVLNRPERGRCHHRKFSNKLPIYSL
ncbi:hypothetical protein PAPYR_11282 [Paratrimastix pyriformis]|uniref:Uncharacterized protein n=1 Tax=Paratrimastix pyriformis TaxID=342808 RepID=A0ABQ8U6X5_9EUKA|nr:hypothetical protein PAPYR_11282 [Paratrimastix pyriformis]